MIVKKTNVLPIHRKLASFENGREKTKKFEIASFSSDQSPNIFSISHETSYTYSSQVNYSKHLFRLQPIMDEGQTILHYEFSVLVNKGEVSNFTGVFGNHASFIEIKAPYTELRIVSQSIVCIQDVPIRTELLHQPRTLPMIWMPWDRVMLQAYLQPPELAESELFELAEYAMSFVNKNHNDVFALLNDMNQTIYREFSYVPGETSLFTTPYQVYIMRKGVCQDFANLLICLARLLDIPARYRVGYIYTDGNYENKIQSDATHAWVEIYLPYLGWLGFDPTNGCMAGKNHIKVACGRHYRDATPTSGTIFSAEGSPQETLTTSVQVISLNRPLA